MSRIGLPWAEVVAYASDERLNVANRFYQDSLEGLQGDDRHLVDHGFALFQDNLPLRTREDAPMVGLSFRVGYLFEQNVAELPTDV
jgi:hypothetical protein